jgi:hypothetical protein
VGLSNLDLTFTSRLACISYTFAKAIPQLAEMGAIGSHSAMLEDPQVSDACRLEGYLLSNRILADAIFAASDLFLRNLQTLIMIPIGISDHSSVRRGRKNNTIHDNYHIQLSMRGSPTADTADIGHTDPMLDPLEGVR